MAAASKADDAAARHAEQAAESLRHEPREQQSPTGGADGGQAAGARKTLSAEAAALLARRMDGWIASMERLRLADYVRYVDDRKRLFFTSFMAGMARGIGMAVGFTILGALLVLILQDLAKRNLPLIGDVLAQIVTVVQKRLQ